uniref:Kinesin-like protein n=1 Tax=Chrysotila carterae TaxID=13221 RepID=A0A7S4AY98_CHRCT
MRVRVCVRSRPLLPRELSNGAESTFLRLEPQVVRVAAPRGGQASYNVDCAYGAETSQEAFFASCGIEPLIAAVLDGYHGTVFAYGQTGSGKTFTMEGYEYLPAAPGKAPHVDVAGTPPARLGVVPRAVRALYGHVAERNKIAAAENGNSLRVVCSFVQVYKEQVLDLLNPALPNSLPSNGVVRGLKIRYSATRDFYVENLFVEEAADADHALSLFEGGVRHKRMAETRMNAASSRSHCLFTLTVQQLERGTTDSVVAEGRLTLVDLAGSERQSALIEGGRAAMQDSVEINKSLFTLRKVILALSDRKEGKLQRAAHVPYRDSTLTRLLKHSLGGSCHTLMIACISPSDSHVDENTSTLSYAARARAITNAPTVNVDPKLAQVRAMAEEIRSLKAEISRLQQLLRLSGIGDAGGGGSGDCSGGGSGMVTASDAAAASRPAPIHVAACPPTMEGVLSPDKRRRSPGVSPSKPSQSALTPSRRNGGRDGETAVGTTWAGDGRLQKMLEVERKEGAVVGQGLLEGVQLARQLAQTNAKLRDAFDLLAEQRNELQRAHVTLMQVKALQERGRVPGECLGSCVKLRGLL